MRTLKERAAREAYQRRKRAEAASLNMMADAIREMLGLDPISRPGDKEGLRPKDAQRFYRAPFSWKDPMGSGRTPQRGGSWSGR